MRLLRLLRLRPRPVHARLVAPARAWCLAVALAVPAAPALAGCPPPDWPQARLQALKAEQWKLDDEGQRTALAIELLDCLAHPDPLLRDEIAFEALAAWLRGGALTLATARELGLRLVDRLLLPDAAGFGGPFAALALAEVARVDRVSAIWTPAERQGVVDVSTQWLRSVTDHRGWDPAAGWRHAVAHGADLMMQLAMNPALERAQLDQMLDALAAQVMPANGHSYVHGESERLVRPVVFVARRALHSEADWSAWFGRLAAAVQAAGAAAPTTLQALARRHNLKSFLYPLYAAVQEGSDAELRRRLLPGLLAALRALR